ncbi:hypothetical protein GOODEAATRI_027039 [Goodea atripinnis]|uniref:THAP-type domain-containing protein n=1 Tax=Goodea atripinnis TaxID=208336 RepID=A0ABV0PHR1_9TELE
MTSAQGSPPVLLAKTGFCSNTNKDGVSLFKFPKDPELRSKWVKQVRCTREKWEPTPSSVLCSEHFEVDCFDVVPVLKKSLSCSVQHKRVLRPSTVPTVFPRSVRECVSGSAGPGPSSSKGSKGASVEASPASTSTSSCTS